MQRVNQPTGMDASEYSAYSDAESVAEGGGISAYKISDDSGNGTPRPNINN